MRVGLEQFEFAPGALERQLTRLPAQLVALQFRLRDELLVEELLRPLVLVLRLLDLLFLERELSLLVGQLRRILTFLVLGEILLREQVTLLRKLNVRGRLVLLDLQFLAGHLQGAPRVLNRDLLTVLLVDLGGDIELHKHIALLDHRPFGDERNDADAALDLVLQHDLLTRRDLAELLDADHERTLRRRRIQRRRAFRCGSPPQQQESDERHRHQRTRPEQFLHLHSRFPFRPFSITPSATRSASFHVPLTDTSSSPRSRCNASSWFL